MNKAFSALALATISTLGCANPDPREGVFTCDPANIASDCPADFLGCRPGPGHTDNRCYRMPNEGVDAGVDAFIAQLDAPGDAAMPMSDTPAMPDTAMDAWTPTDDCGGDPRLGQDCTPGNACQVGMYECVGGVVRCEGQRDTGGQLIRDVSYVCRPAAGPCDVADRCNGSALTCPADARQPASFVCRAAVSDCDAAEQCSGSDTGSVTCPADAFRPIGANCTVGGGAGYCAGDMMCNDSCPTGQACVDPTNPCRVGTIRCSSGGMAVCDSFTNAPAGTLCRPATGACDAAEICSGSVCPADTFLSSTTMCRTAASGGCDVAEFCTGTAAACPPNAFVSAGSVCRSPAGACDVREFCSGTTPTCPTDVLSPSGTMCASAMGACDEPDFCSGTSAMCTTRITACDASMPSDAGSPGARDASDAPDAPDAPDASSATTTRDGGPILLEVGLPGI